MKCIVKSSNVLITVVCSALLLRLLIAQYPHSGMNKPPIYGDYEAQRHWQEITYSLPMNEWYPSELRNNSFVIDNDPNYWGLDYPPLTAYHSYILGWISENVFNRTEWIKLYESRGYENVEHKIFMRISVIVTDFLFYFFPLLYFIMKLTSMKESDNNSIRNQVICLLLIIVEPNINLIDHGHFQYNSISLGLFIISTLFFLEKSSSTIIIFSSFFFTLALNYKQMELFHAIPIFLFILMESYRQRNFSFIIYAAFTVLITTLIIWLPLIMKISFIHLLSNIDQLKVSDVIYIEYLKIIINRIFPIQRSLFEDKVSNFWFLISIFVKLKQFLPINQLVTMSTIVTFSALLPGIIIFLKSSCHYGKYSKKFENYLFLQILSSLSFYLFSYQVHEKSILLVNTPIILLFIYSKLNGRPSKNRSYLQFQREKEEFCLFFLSLSLFSMMPLLCKDGLIIPYISFKTIRIYHLPKTLRLISTKPALMKGFEDDRKKIYRREVGEEIKVETVRPVDEKGLTWISHGFSFRDRIFDEWLMRNILVTFFITVTVGGILILGYEPDRKLNEWAQREAFLVIEERQRNNLPFIAYDYIPRSRMEKQLPPDDEVDEKDLIL
ncbi:hypothetical protein SNEBB_004450 [Seison nebaliae]|nr:hypothetical protein SNEBB_004450 [Seison nebaliae]